MKVTIKYNIPIGDFRAMERTESFHADSSFEATGTSLVYFRIGRYGIRSVAKETIIKIEED